LIRIGIIGYGYWGPNIARVFNAVDGCEVVSICDTKQEALKRASKIYPDIRITTDPDELVSSPDIDAVAVITPVFAHYELAKRRSCKASMSSWKSPSPTPRPRRKT
jgi:predicted dehydrogenase